MTTPIDRLSRIRELLLTETIGSQDELAERLETEGYAATQSGISRDLKKIGVAKVKGAYRIADQEDESGFEDFAGSLRHLVTAGPHLIIVGTTVGSASRVGLELDRASWPEILGTIAGDDTVFVAVKNAQTQKQVLRKLQNALRKGSNS